MDKRLWTPGGEVPVADDAATGGATAPPQPQAPGTGGPQGAPAGAPAGGPGGPEQLSEEEIRAYIEQARSVPVANVVVMMIQQAAELVQINLIPPADLDDAKLAIDTAEGIVGAVADQLPADRAALDQMISELKLAFVEATKKAESGPESSDESAGAPEHGEA